MRPYKPTFWARVENRTAALWTEADAARIEADRAYQLAKRHRRVARRSCRRLAAAHAVVAARAAEHPRTVWVHTAGRSTIAAIARPETPSYRPWGTSVRAWWRSLRLDLDLVEAFASTMAKDTHVFAAPEDGR